MDKTIHGEKQEMKYLAILFYYIIFLWTISCSNTPQKNQNIALSFIESFLEKGATIEEVKEIFGNPHRIKTYKKIKEEMYEYDNIEHSLVEWIFGVDKSGNIVWVNHKPWSNPLLDRIEIFPITWKKYRCKKEIRPNRSNPHVIQNYRFFECANGKLRGHYNLHGEISTIEVNR